MWTKLSLAALIVALAAAGSSHGWGATSVDAFPAAAQLVTVTGKLQFPNRDNTGFISPRRFYAELWPATGNQPFFDSLGQTDDQGNFTLTTSQYTGGDVRVGLLSAAPYPGNDVTVEPQIGDPYWVWVSPPFDLGPNLTHSAPFAEDMLPAFWIMDDLTEGFDKVPSADQADIWLRVFWDPLFTHLGPADRSFMCYDPPPFACDDEGRLYIFQQDVRQLIPPFHGLPERLPLHEMGHPLMYYMYGEKMPAPSTDYWLGPCSSWSPPSKLAGNADCAWQEGWADWWRLYAQDSPIVTFLSGGQRDYENPDPGWESGDEVPGRITAALWDMYDGAGDGGDVLWAKGGPIWDSLAQWAGGGRTV